MPSPAQKLAAEFIGTALLLATVIGSGIAGQEIADGSPAITLLISAVNTGAILYVLITMLAPISGAHFNPVVSLVFTIKGELSKREAVGYTIAQVIGACFGVMITHIMFGNPIIQLSENTRSGLFISEFIATSGLIFIILATLKAGKNPAASVGLYIMAGYWFTASGAFANPAATFARMFTDSFAGIAPGDAPMFIIAQILAAPITLIYANWQLKDTK